MLERSGNRASLSTVAPQLGRSLCALGRYDEAEPLAWLGRELGGQQDFATQMLWRQVQARVDAQRGEHAQAERLAREAVAIGERTDALNSQGDALCDLAEVLAPPTALRRPPPRSSKRSTATSASRTSPWSRRYARDSTRYGQKFRLTPEGPPLAGTSNAIGASSRASPLDAFLLRRPRVRRC
jgi:hypothetical protein